MHSSHSIQLYITPESDCSYLPGRASQLVCLNQDFHPDTALFSALTEQGFRRSGTFIYRPQCHGCQACVPVRLPVEQFIASKQQRRTIKRGSQLSVSKHLPEYTKERYQLYQRYISNRHADGSMFPPSQSQFESFLCQRTEYSRFYEFRLEQKLMAVAVTDVLDDGLSAVYSFFEPEDRYFSLGRYAILWQIMHAQRLQLDYLYLGYWIENHDKMHYKQQYQPLQGLISGSWKALN